MTREELRDYVDFLRSQDEISYDVYSELIDGIDTLDQEPKTGHWEMPVQDDGMSDPIYYQVRCSKCGFDLDPQTWHMELHQYGADKYCPKCGAKMVEPQKSEDKNDSSANLCDSCVTEGCIFQTGIVRSHCDFYKAERSE